MDSPARSGALVLRGLVAADPAHPLAARLARGLLRQRSGGSWRSTQETAFALLALDAYRHAQERELPDYVARAWLGEAELLNAPMRGRSILAQKAEIPAARLPASSLLTFQKQGTGKLFYEARLTYARKSLPQAPLDRGLFVQKTLRRVDPAELERALATLPDRSQTRFGAGDLVLADLVIVTPSPRQYVVIDDPLPAGFEAVDARLATTAAWLDVPSSDETHGPGADDALAHGRAFLSSLHRREIRDDRVLFFVDQMAAGMYRYRYLARATTIGSFVQPPARAEAMYTPEVFGRTAATRIEITGGGS
jgi:alpha-2-macroglobulin